MEAESGSLICLSVALSVVSNDPVLRCPCWSKRPAVSIPSLHSCVEMLERYAALSILIHSAHGVAALYHEYSVYHPTTVRMIVTLQWSSVKLSMA